ncbi:hypothetical protein JQK87_37495, partial [Streptomyces sp. G44]|nr:hypothetical protein [Streptomyces sp. G44]
FAPFSPHFQRAAQQAALDAGAPQLAAVSVSPRSFDRWMAGDLKRMPWPSTCRVLECLFGEPAGQLFGPQCSYPAAPSAPPMPSFAGLVKADDDPGAAPYLGAVESFRRADRQLGAGHVYSSLQQYLRTSIADDLFGARDRPAEPAGTGVVLATAVLTEMAGWMAHDMGRDRAASTHFRMALGLSQATPEVSVGANILASMSHLALQTGDIPQAVSFARLGQERLRGT